MKTYYEVWNLFYDREFVGNILRYSTLLEVELNAVIAQYFIRSDKYEEAMEILLPELSLGKKIDLLTQLPMRKSLISYRQAIYGLRQFQRVRNIVAHNPSISQSRAKSLANDDNCKRILLEYPEGMKDQFVKTRNSLKRLLKVREFRNPQTNKIIDSAMIDFLRWTS